MKAKLYVNGFIIYFVFAIIGSNLNIGVTALSFGNLSLILLSAIMFYQKGTMWLTEKQRKLFIPLVLYTLLVSFYFVTAIDHMSGRIISKYFYLISIPVLYVMITNLGNNYGDYFFRRVYFILKIILSMLLAVVLMELTLNIHMPSYAAENRLFNMPTAFFVNSNDLSTISVILYVLFVGFNEKYGNRKEFYLFTAITFFLVVVSFSRVAVLSLVVFFPLYFIIVRHKSARYVLIIGTILIISVYTLSSVVVSYVPNRQLDLAGWINNRLLSLSDEKTYDTRASGSTGVRFEIYSYPFANPDEFIIGYGLLGDEIVLEKVVRWSGITNAHSFFVESIYDFGWIGFILILFFFINILVFLIRNGSSDNFKFAIIQVVLFMLLINVSSSIIGKPIIWAPIFIYLAYITRKSEQQ